MVSESEVLHLKPGQSVKILPKVYPGATLEGTINSVGVKAGPGLKYEVEISLNNSKEFPLKAGMFATVNLNGKESRKMLAIDKKAIVGSYYDAHVFVVRNNMAYKQAVTIGQITNNKAEVLAGLDAGMQVVVSGQINLKDGTNINPVN